SQELTEPGLGELSAQLDERRERAHARAQALALEARAAARDAKPQPRPARREELDSIEQPRQSLRPAELAGEDELRAGIRRAAARVEQLLAVTRANDRHLPGTQAIHLAVATRVLG